MVDPTINLPSPQDVENIWQKYATPLHIREHMKQVNRVAMHLASRLSDVGERVILPLVDRASLLHDTLRVTEWDTLSFEYFSYTPSKQEIEVWTQQRKRFPSHIPHAQVNYEIFHEEYPEMARVILMHSIGSTPKLSTWEEKIVNYADRRVAHDRIVTLTERLEEAYQRYSRTTQVPLEKDPAIIEAIFQLEKNMFSLIGENPDHLQFD